MAETTEELTPLKKKLDDFGSFLSKVCILCSSCHSFLPSHVFPAHQCLAQYPRWAFSEPS